ncbi:MAG: outer membrane beta-barrel protein [Armatimonadetes bacterium]|nr:outer membrane beta-barrel protein [Armatimonadota bacterium]
MKKTLLLTLCGLAALTSTAFAAGNPVGGTVRLGLFRPNDGDTRDVTADSWFGFGLDYKLRDVQFGNSPMKYSYMISLDYLNKSADFGSLSGDMRTMPILFNVVASMDNGFYYMAGAGVAFTRFSGLVLTAPEARGTSSVVTENRTKFAYQVGVGYNLPGQTPLSIDLRYMGNGDKELSGFGLFLGYKF